MFKNRGEEGEYDIKRVDYEIDLETFSNFAENETLLLYKYACQ